MSIGCESAVCCWCALCFNSGGWTGLAPGSACGLNGVLLGAALDFASVTGARGFNGFDCPVRDSQF